MPAPWIGAHVTANPGPWGRQNQVDQLRAMHASTARLQMYTGGGQYILFNGSYQWRPWFADAEVDAIVQVIRENGGVHLIMQSSELVTVDASAGQQNSIADQWNTAKFFARRYPDLTLTFEIGNEPDVNFPNAPEATRDRYMRCVQYCRGSKPSNAMIGVSNVLGNADYFNRFSTPGPYGSPIHDVDVVCTHCYLLGGNRSFCPGSASNGDDWARNIRWIRSWNADKTIFVTEAGIETADRNYRAPRNVEFAYNIQRWSQDFSRALKGVTGGYCDVACFYCVGYDVQNGVETVWRINETDTPYYGNRTLPNPRECP